MVEGNTWIVLLLASLGTFAWRAAGVLIAAHIRVESVAFQWVSCVAYAILAALIARIMVLPVGMLAQSEAVDRYLALVVGFALFFLFRRRLVVGLTATLAVFAGLTAARAYGIL